MHKVHRFIKLSLYSVIQSTDRIIPMKKLLLILLCAGLFKLHYAQSTPNWAQNIAPILYANCTSCHHDGGLSPFPLMSYNDAYNNYISIQSDVVARIMPPWPPDPTYSRLAHERILSLADIEMINDWANGGAPMGDTMQAPTPPVYKKGSQLDTVSLSLIIPTYTVPINQTDDIYQCFALPSGLLQNMFITEMEIVPGNPSIVHHVLVFQDTTGTCAQLDAASPGPGYVNFGGVGTNKAILVGGWVPGGQPYTLPPNFGIPVFAGTDIVLQVHYPNGGNGQSDSTRINLKLVPNVSRQVSVAPILNHLTNINAPLFIPADSTKTFNEHYKGSQLPVDVSVLTVGPHCHLLGKHWVSFAVTPQLDTIPFIQVDNWNFRWQGFYSFRNVMKVPAGSNLWAFCYYDNTVNNPTNPNNPPQDVSLGENTTDEMMLVYFSYLPYEAGDENIVIDSTPLVDLVDSFYTTGVINTAGPIVSTPQLYEAVPNPANGQTMFSYFLPANIHTELRIYDLTGKLVEVLNVSGKPGYNRVNYDTSKLSSGTYVYSLVTDSRVTSKQLVIMR